MESVTSSHRISLKQWSPMAFLGAGALLLGHAAVMGVQAFTSATVPADVFAPVGHLLALVGLLGLYPVASGRAPSLARIGAVAAAVIAVGWVMVTGSILATTFASPPPQFETLFGVFSILVLVSTVVPYVLFGVGILRSDTASRNVGLLLLAPAGLLIVLLADIAIFGASPLDGVVIGSGLTLSMLAIGFTLRARGVQADRPSPDRDATPG